MAGQKATEAEKEQIRGLYRQGYNIDDVMTRYPHLDGRVVGGIYQRFKLTQGAPEGGVSASPGAPPPGRSATPESPGVKTPALEQSEKLGFTPSSDTPNTPGGFKPAFREYFIIKKLDPPNDGIKGTEYPPFTVVELMDRYPSGDYEVQHYREGKLFQTYRERVSVRGPQGGSGMPVTAERKVEMSPADMFLKAMDVTHRLHTEAKGEAASARAVEAQATVAREDSKARVETAAMVGLMDIVKEQTKAKPDSTAPYLQSLSAMMQEQNTASIERHKRDMEELRTRQKHEADLERDRLKQDRDLERDRIKADNDKFKEEMHQRQQDRDAFLTKMSEIEAKRDEFHRESYERMITEIGTTREAAELEIKERKESAKELIEVQKKFNDEMIALKKTMGGADKDLEVAKIIKDGITGGLDRIGHRVDLLVKSGAIGDGRKIETTPPKVDTASTAAKVDAAAATPATEEKKAVFTDDEAKNELKSPWFQNMKKEIVITVRMRGQGRKLNGALLGQVFINNLNAGKVTVAHLHFICSRTWKRKKTIHNPSDPPEVFTFDPDEPLGILDIAYEAITDAERLVIDTEEGEKWFGEFVYFLSEAYNSSIPATSGQ